MPLHERTPSSPAVSYNQDPIDYAHHDQFVTVVPHHVSPSTLPPAAHRISLKQSPQWPSSFDQYGIDYRGADYHMGSEASSPEATGSLSGSSTGSYSIPRTALDPVQSYPEKAAGSASFALASRAEEGSVVTTADGHFHKDRHGRTSWTSCPLPLSEGQSLRSVRHDEQNSVTVYAGTKEKSFHSREPNAVLVLVLLSMPVPLFSIGTCLYTLLALLFVTFSSPLRLCPPTPFFRSTSFSIQLCQLLVPALRYHERMAQKQGASSSSSHHHHHHHDPYRSGSPTTLTDTFSPTRLVLVLLLAPVLSLGLLLAVWTAAFFWIFAMILGNPDGTERRDDGRAAVLGVNGWWQKWLGKSRNR
ncbi:hypothetical protein VTN77DRAFT_4817 [Rasamsonia byssochlamydoides]|uniref:uncharacterized protein n=1 Tax=Rasamsonia byssochlamydoides TaxID=89139 RepID=UPI0037449BC5